MTTSKKSLIALWMIQRLSWTFAQTPLPGTEQTAILWSLAPCQSAFWVPSTTSEFTQNWITYQFEGNPLSQSGECIFTLESDPDTKIEMSIQQLNLFGSGLSAPPACLSLYDVKSDGSIASLKKQCNSLMASDFDAYPTLTETNLAVVSTTIRYGSFQIQARAVPKTFGFPTKVSSTTNFPHAAVESTPIPMVLPMGSSTTPPPKKQPAVTMVPSVEIVTPMHINSTGRRFFN